MSLDFIPEELAQIRKAGLHRAVRELEGARVPRVKRNGRGVILLASNSYLGLANHPDVVEAARDAVRRFGTSSGGSRLLTGSMHLHRELEMAIAHLKGTQDAVLFNTGYQANVGTVPALVGPEDLVLSDELNHASLIDACRLSRATVRIYPHRSTETAATILENERDGHRRCLLLTDGLFSMDGDLAPLPALAALAQKHDAGLMVDDAHGTGVMGAKGSGTAEHLGVTKGVDVHMGTLSKALAAEGGFIAGSHVLCDFLRNRARSFIFSTAQAPPTVASALAALRIVAREPERRTRLHHNHQRLRHGLSQLGYRVHAGEAPVVPIHIGAAATALRLAEQLEAEGVYLPAVRPPTVPVNECRLRATVMATHTEKDLDAVLAAFQRVQAKGVLASAPESS